MAISKQQIAKSFTSALTSYNQNAIAQQQITRQIIQRLKQYIPQTTEFHQVLEIGCGTGDLTQQLMNTYTIQQLTLNDLCAVETQLRSILTTQNYQFIQDDAESFLANNSCGDYDLIISSSTVQWFNHIPMFLQHCTNNLTEQGWLVLSSFAKHNLREIRDLTGVGLTYPDMQQWQNWLDTDFEIVELFEQEIILSFNSPMEVLKHLKYSGVTATNNQHWTKGRLQNFCEQYQQRYGSQNKVQLTYNPLYIFARKKK